MVTEKGKVIEPRKHRSGEKKKKGIKNAENFSTKSGLKVWGRKRTKKKQHKLWIREPQGSS